MVMRFVKKWDPGEYQSCNCIWSSLVEMHSYSTSEAMADYNHREMAFV